MADPFARRTPQLESPLAFAAAVTPNDSTDLATSSRALYVGASGAVKVTLVGGSTVTLVGLAAGVWHPMRVQRVWSTGTTAADIVAGW